MHTQDFIDQQQSDALENFSSESFSQPELRYQAQFFDSKIAENLIRNMNRHNLGLSRMFIDGITLWLNVYGHPVVGLSNQTNREKEFALRARIALYSTPCRKTDLLNPHRVSIMRLCEDQYHLTASNATGQNRLGVRILERTTRIYSADETKQQQNWKGKK